MKDEIKEIIKEWKQFLSWCYENNDKTIEIHRDNAEKIIDYITNLQEENKEQKKQLESLIVQLELYKDNKEYLNNKIDKAIEYTERFTNGKYSRIDTFENVEVVLQTILQILKGKSDE